MQPLITPIVNLNGATAQSLIEQRVAVMNALDTAVDAMRQAFPHGRDYQTSRTAFACENARKAWHERMTMLVTLKEEITNDALAIQAQQR